MIIATMVILNVKAIHVSFMFVLDPYHFFGYFWCVEKFISTSSIFSLPDGKGTCGKKFVQYFLINIFVQMHYKPKCKCTYSC
jgi:hypothetical protein